MISKKNSEIEQNLAKICHFWCIRAHCVDRLWYRVLQMDLSCFRVVKLFFTFRRMPRWQHISRGAATEHLPDVRALRLSRAFRFWAAKSTGSAWPWHFLEASLPSTLAPTVEVWFPRLQWSLPLVKSIDYSDFLPLPVDNKNPIKLETLTDFGRSHA